MALDYPYLNLSDMLTSTGMPSTTDTTSISSSNLVSTSLFMAEGLDASSGTSLSMSGWTGPHFSAAHPSNAYSSPHLQLPTPDSSPRLYPYYPHPCNPPVSTSQLAPPLPPMRDFFVCGSSLDESPISSPGDLERDTVQPTATPATGDIGAALRKLGFSNRSPSSLSRFGIAAQTSFDSGSSGEDDASTNHSDRTVQQVPDGIKMPQRKGGMQLWQFLYSMLTNVDGKYHNLIEWTHTARERQFRLLEPDAIAVWWGHHKNKPNMSYDKLSRSLRYYYDKGIIRKISGERFVYRFCIDPEIMYKHMGTSNSRPKLKPMPQDAKIVLSKDRNMRGASACIAKEPETLLAAPETKVENIPPTFPPPYPVSTSYSNSLAIPASSSYAVPPSSVVGSAMRRCHSYDSACRNVNISPEQSPSPSSFNGFPTMYDNGIINFNGVHSPNNSPPHSATLEYKPFTTQPSELPPPSFEDLFTHFPPPIPVMAGNPAFSYH